LVEFKNITKIYDSLISAVYDVNFKLEDGEFVFLIGPSGSGKTTIIKMLIRDEVPTDGSIFFNDVDITKISRRKVYKLRREVGVVFQDFKLVPDKTAYENVSFAMEAAGKKKKEIKETVPYVLDIVGLSNRMQAFPRQLSGGEQQRVAIARAIANNPKILIADEPTGNLDPASSWDIVQVLTKINNWGTTVIMSTHGTDIVNSLNKRVIQMEKGRIIRDDNKGQYELVKAFEENPLDKSKTSEAPKSKEKKKVFQVKIKKDGAESISDVLEDKKDDVDLSNSKVESKPKSSFSKLFNVFRGNKDRDEAIHQSIIDTLSEDKASESENNKKDENLKEEVQSEDPKDIMNFDLKASAKMAKSKKDEKVEAVESNEVSEKDMGKALADAGNLNIDDMNLPKSVKADLKKAGYKTAQDIINAGVDNLEKNLVIDPEEVILISKEIKKLVE